MEKPHKVRTPLFPRYSEAKALIKIWDSCQKFQVKHLIQSIANQMGTPQDPVDWSDPDKWIPKRLNGDDATLALRIWKESKNTINPRHTYGSYLFINRYDLLVEDHQGTYSISDKGQDFLWDKAKILRDLDDSEGLIKLLSILASKPKAKKSELIPEWGEFLREYSKFGTKSTIADTLWRRLNNLLERNLISKESIHWSITDKGLKYLESSEGPGDPKTKILKSLNSHKAKQCETLKTRLTSMPPYQFEKLIRDLLEAMGYSDVLVTKEVGDKGVDVIGTIQFGITTIKEVVQVKKHQTNIQRSVLDQLRGALPYHEAIRGTIITIGGFSRGCQEAALFPGAAPIGLIDGDMLLDLLMEHEIGIKKRPITMWEVDEGYFEEPEEPEQITEEI